MLFEIGGTFPLVELEFHNGIENIPLGRLWQGVDFGTVGAPNAYRSGAETAQRFRRPGPKGRTAGSCKVLHSPKLPPSRSLFTPTDVLVRIAFTDVIGRKPIPAGLGIRTICYEAIVIT